MHLGFSDYDKYDDFLEDMELHCKNCHSGNLLCSECGLYWDVCDCASVEVNDLICMGCSSLFKLEELLDITEEDMEEMMEKLPLGEQLKCTCVPQAKFFCGKCQVTRSTENGEWRKVTITNTGGVTTVKPATTTSKYPAAKGNTWGNSKYTGPDRHYGVDKDLGNGVIVHPSSMNNERNKDGKSQVIPDFGLYADYGWRPTWRNEMINWPDYGVPKSYETAAAQIVDAYNRAVDDEYVEFGCIGGHGRTGTILACMKLLAERTSDNHDFTYKDAIDWVRKDYCDHAIESEMQEWWVGWFDHYQHGTDLPPKPEPKPKTYGSTNTVGSCSAASHYAMQQAGWKTCAKIGNECKWWEKDLEDFANPNKDNTTTAKTAQKDIEKYKKQLEEESAVIPLAEFEDCEWEEHYAMMKAGYSNCCRYGAKCKYFEEDIKEFANGKLSHLDMEKVRIFSEKYKPVKKQNNRNRRRRGRGRGRRS